MRGRLFIWLQHVLPQHRLSRLVLAATRVRTRWFKNLLTRAFLALFAVDMAEAIEADPYRYASFNEFFTRALRPEARPIAAGAAEIASPVDGTVSECGASSATRCCKPRAGATRSGSCWRSKRGRGASKTVPSRPCISRRTTITASTCRCGDG